MSPRCLCNAARSWFSGAVALALVLGSNIALAAPSHDANSLTVADVAQVRCADIALKRGGTLLGQVVNTAGVGVPAVEVQLTNGRQTWTSRTGSQGWFQLTELRGGTYLLQAAGKTQRIRAWTAGTAPPHACQGVLIAPTTDVVRGQRVVSPNTNQFFRVAKQRLTNPWVVGGIVATAVTIPVAIHNADDDDPPATP